MATKLGVGDSERHAVRVAATLPGDPPPFFASWRPPAAAWCADHRPTIQEALGSLKVHCEPAPEPFVRELLARCAVVKAGRESSKAEWKIRSKEFVRLLGHYPADIWQAAIDAHMLASLFFPDISELEERMSRTLAERRTAITRLETMLAPRLAPPAAPSETPEQREDLRAKLRRLSTALSSGMAERMTEAEHRHYCETGEHPKGWEERAAATPRAPAPAPPAKPRPPTARQKRRAEALQTGGDAARAKFLGQPPPATEGGAET